MPTGSEKSLRIAHVEDAATNDSGSSFEGIESTRKYAVAAGVGASKPVKERPNTGKSRIDKRFSSRRTASPPPVTMAVPQTDLASRSPERRSRASNGAFSVTTSASGTDSEDSGQIPSGGGPSRERVARPPASRACETSPQRRDASASRRMRSSASKPPTVQSESRQQPGVRRARASETISSGVRQQTVLASRPRVQTRPASDYAGRTTGLHNVDFGWHPAQIPQPPMPTDCYPPRPFWTGPGGPPMAGLYGPPLPPPVWPPPGDFDPAMGSHPPGLPIHQAGTRPASAWGLGDHPGSGFGRETYYSGPRPAPMTPMGHSPPCIQRPDYDSRRMPPPSFIPARCHTTVPPPMPYCPPQLAPCPPRAPYQPQSPRPPFRRSADFYDGLLYGRDDEFSDTDFDPLFNDLSPDPGQERRRSIRSQPRRGHGSPNSEFTPTSGRRRRASVFGTGLPYLGGMQDPAEHKLKTATRYQEQANGAGRGVLTAESLRKAARRDGGWGNGPAWSSGEREDGDLHRMGTMAGSGKASNAGNDEFTIKVPGNAIVRLQGAEIECSGGGEISWSSRPGGSQAGSDGASVIYWQQPEDWVRARSDYESRHQQMMVPNQADSHSRGYVPIQGPMEPAFAGGAFF